MSFRRRTAALLVLPAALATACSSSSSGSGSVAPSGMPTDAAGLGQLLHSAVAKVSSAHVTLEITLSGQQLTGSGDETLKDGQLTGLDLTENLPGGQGAIEVVLAGGRTFAKLPASLNSSPTPWLLVTPNSSNQVIQQLASSLDTALSSASLGSLGTFTRAAKSVEAKGTQSIGGVNTTHYKVVVDVAKLPADTPGKSELESSGVHEIPIDLYVDDQGRPVQVNEGLTVQGTTVTTKATVTDFNKPVTITAPPANQVGH